tara:strand:+ start:236 stop:607 length:372 start_codon:yes stop_codon:yes gene_type:complete
MSGDSPYSFLRGKKGAREKASVKPQNEDERVIADREDKSGGLGFQPSQPMGSVGLSMTVGMATKFAREKLEVTVWETRPVYMDPGDREQAKKEIAADLTKEAQMRLDGMVREFFPHMLEDGND